MERRDGIDARIFSLFVSSHHELGEMSVDELLLVEVEELKEEKSKKSQDVWERESKREKEKERKERERKGTHLQSTLQESWNRCGANNACTACNKARRSGIHYITSKSRLLISSWLLLRFPYLLFILGLEFRLAGLDQAFFQLG